MPGPDSPSEQWTVTDGNAQKNEFTDNKAPIVKDNQGTVNINQYNYAPPLPPGRSLSAPPATYP
jgi:hypothetical protein